MHAFITLRAGHRIIRKTDLPARPKPGPKKGRGRPRIDKYAALDEELIGKANALFVARGGNLSATEAINRVTADHWQWWESHKEGQSPGASLVAVEKRLFSRLRRQPYRIRGKKIATYPSAFGTLEIAKAIRRRLR